MKFSFFVIPIEKVDVYKGTSEKGDYIIGTWKLQGVNGNDCLIAKAFSNIDNKLEKCRGREVSVEFDIKHTEYNGKFYNNIMVTFVDYNEEQDVPSNNEASITQTSDTYMPRQVADVSSSSIMPESSDDLPF